MKKEQKNEMDAIQSIDETFPHQINAPSFKGTGIKIERPFINSKGVVIGDHQYTSENSPLENWDENTDPEVMAGDEWVHPTNDIGWNSAENRELLEEKRPPKGVPFMHPTKDTSYTKD